MGSVRVLFCAVMIAVLAAVELPAVGAPAPQEASAMAATSAARARTVRLREAASLSEALDALLPSPAVGPGLPAADLGSLPASIPPPIRGLAASVARATAAVRAATEGLDRAAARAFLRWRHALPPLGTVRSEASDPSSVSEAARRTDMMWRARARETERRLAPILATYERELLAAAARLVTEALDEALPRLLALKPAAPPAPSRTEGCDLVDLVPVLCMGGTGANRYTEDVALLVDVGGLDVYENSAGGANVLNPSALPVSVNVDLGGDDRYVRETLAGDNSFGVLDPVQGAGIFGVGVLVDVGGDDTYLHRAVPDPDGPDVQGPRVDAQGEGVFGGTGILADLGGDDAYSLDVTASRPADRGAAFGQGVGAIGYGLLIDRGWGEDTYTMLGGVAGLRPAATEGLLDGGQQDIEGQGEGSLGGTGALVDDGGVDRFTISSSTDPGPGIHSYARYEFELGPSTQVFGQGYGTTGGAGFLVTGPGPTIYELRAEGSSLGYHQVFGQGTGNLGAVGVVDDAGGDDVYRASSHMAAEALEEGGPDAQAAISGLRTLTTQDVLVQGHARFYGSAGALVDRAGDDRYEVQYRSEVVARAEATAGSARATAVSFSAGPLEAQATANSGGAALLLDEEGDDVYEVRIETRADAGAVAPATASPLAVATWLQPTLVLAQGATTYDADAAMLADLGGSDTYRAVGRTLATASPDVRGAREQGGMALFQGSGPNAVLVDHDSSEPDGFVSEPNFEDTCSGFRGESPGWTECPVGSDRPDPFTNVVPERPLGTGSVDSAPAKGQPALTIDASTPTASSGERTIFVEGRLTDASGAPLAGRLVEARLQIEDDLSVQGEVPLLVFWVDAGAMHAATDADGRFSAPVYVPPIDREVFPGRLRLWVGFSGDETLRGAGDGIAFTYEG